MTAEGSTDFTGQGRLVLWLKNSFDCRPVLARSQWQMAGSTELAGGHACIPFVQHSAAPKEGTIIALELKQRRLRP